MATYVVWLDYQEAKIFKLSPEASPADQKKRMRMYSHKHFKHPHGKHDQHHPEADKWFHDLAESLKGDATEILLIGAGEAKGHFKTYLERKYSGLGKSIVGVETVDHPTEGELLARARSFFRDYDLFH